MATVFVIAGAKTAPRGRFAAAIVLAVLWMLYSFTWHVLVHPVEDVRHYTQFLVATLTAASWAAHIAYSEKSSRTPR